MLELDRSILVRAQAGDAAAQAAFLRRYSGPMRALVRRMGARGEDEDELQELFVTLLRALPRFSPEGPAQLTTWVFAVGHRFLLARRRKARLQLVPLGASREAIELAALCPSSEELLAQRERLAALGAALETLPEPQRAVFVQAQLHEQPLEAIAEREQVPLGTIKSRLHRARAELMRLLRKKDEEETHAHAR